MTTAMKRVKHVPRDPDADRIQIAGLEARVEKLEAGLRNLRTITRRAESLALGKETYSESYSTLKRNGTTIVHNVNEMLGEH